MKKITAIILSLVLALSVTACGAEQVKQIKTPTGISNPVQDATAQSILDDIGIDFSSVSDYDNLSFHTIASDPAIAEACFTLDGINYTYRVAPAAEEMDISGMYYEFDESAQTEVCSVPGNAYVCNEEGKGYISWFDVVPGLMYSLSMDSDASIQMLNLVANTIFVPVQGNSDGE